MLLLLLLGAIAFCNAKPLPIIFDTDIGDDFDDSWAITLAISNPDKWDVRMILTAAKNTPARAQIVAKYLTRYNRTDIPIGIGVKTSSSIGGLYPWASDIDIDAYNASTGGKVHADGVKAARDLIMSSSEPISYVAIAPESNFGAIVDRYPEMIPKVKMIYGMFGAIDLCYGLHPITTKGSCPEYNVGEDKAAAKKMISAAWPMTITPLDTCDYFMDGEPWKRMQAANNSDHRLVSTLLESLQVWGNGRYPPGCGNTDIIYDAIATYMSGSLTQFNMKNLTVNVENNGATVRDPNGKPMNVALTWINGGKDKAMGDIADMIIAAK